MRAVYSALALCCGLGRAIGMFIGDTLFQSLQSAAFCNTYLRVAPSDAGIVSLGREFHRRRLDCIIHVDENDVGESVVTIRPPFSGCTYRVK